LKHRTTLRVGAFSETYQDALVKVDYDFGFAKLTSISAPAHPAQPCSNTRMWIKIIRRRSVSRPVTRNGFDGRAASISGANVDGPFEISEARWLTGGASKLQMAFTLNSELIPGVKLVLRMEPAASVCETSRLREFQLLTLFQNVVPVPEPYWVDRDGSYLPYPALIYAFSDGVTKPSRTTSNVSGLGTNLGPALRGRLAPQFIDQLAKIHLHPLRPEVLTAFQVPDGPTGAAERALNWWERVWTEDADQEIPLMRLAAGWMRANLRRTDRLSIIHADYRTGNFLFDEGEAKITAWLDWELGHIGDRHEDLAWSMSRAFGHNAENSSDFLICGLLPRSEFLAAYSEASGLAVDPAALHFYRILAVYKAIVIVLGAGYRNAHNGQSHQDVLLVWLMGLASTLLEELRELLEEVI
jgi:aminoglycoside phosphotransferase (APT) family kinase protein